MTTSRIEWHGHTNKHFTKRKQTQKHFNTTQFAREHSGRSGSHRHLSSTVRIPIRPNRNRKHIERIKYPVLTWTKQFVNTPWAAAAVASKWQPGSAGLDRPGYRRAAPRTRGIEEVRTNCQRSCGNRAAAALTAHARAARQQPCSSLPTPAYPLNRTSYPAVRTPLPPCNFWKALTTPTRS